VVQACGVQPSDADKPLLLLLLLLLVAAKGTATILVTSATGSSGNFRKTSFGLPLGGNCPRTC
jgi:hypothetical protein